MALNRGSVALQTFIYSKIKCGRCSQNRDFDAIAETSKLCCGPQFKTMIYM